MINAVNSNVSFSALPASLQGLPIQGRRANGICTIIKEACREAGVPVKTSPKKVLMKNAKIFDQDGRVTGEGAGLLREEYDGAITCDDLYNNLTKSYKKHGGHGVLDWII